MADFKKTILIDFDGVLHSYTSKWEGPDVIPDPPVPAAINWLRGLLDHDDFDPQVYSSRSKYPEGIAAMKRWFLAHGLSEEHITRLPFPTEKPGAWLTIDDRAICFEGIFPNVDELNDFVPWNRK